MKTTTAKKKTTTVNRSFRPAEGIGFDATTGDQYGLKNNPAVVLAIHPVIGTTAYGPFLNMKAAREWSADDAPLEVGNCYGSLAGWTFHAVSLEVLGRWD
jgi:hypothetical protein